MRCKMKSETKKRQCQLRVLQISVNVSQIVVWFVEKWNLGHEIHDLLLVNAIELTHGMQRRAQLVDQVLNIIRELIS